MASDTGVKPQKEINRLKIQVKHLQKEKDKSFPDLGKATYEAFIQGRLKDAGLVEACERLRAFDTQVEQANTEIARLQSVLQQMKAAPPVQPQMPGARCPVCGAGVNPGLRFCGNCGAPRQVAPATPVAGGTCTSCSSAIQPGVRFCGECGKPVAVAPQAAPPAALAPPPPAAPEPPASPPPPPAPAAAPPPVVSAPATTIENSAPAGQDAAGKKCPSCGAPSDEEGAAFCGECGARF